MYQLGNCKDNVASYRNLYDSYATHLLTIGWRWELAGAIRSMRPVLLSNAAAFLMAARSFQSHPILRSGEDCRHFNFNALQDIAVSQCLLRMMRSSAFAFASRRPLSSVSSASTSADRVSSGDAVKVGLGATQLWLPARFIRRPRARGRCALPNWDGVLCPVPT